MELTTPVSRRANDVRARSESNVSDLIGYIASGDSVNVDSTSGIPLAGSIETGAPDAAQTPPVVELLPALRSELKLEPVQFDKTGQPKWTLQDPIRGKYYRLGWLEFELLSRWACSDISTLIRRINSETTLRVHRGHVDSFLAMLKNNELIFPESVEDFQALNTKTSQSKPSALKKAFSSSMFYRKPLVNPDGFLTALNSVIQPLYSVKKWLILCWALLAAIALNGVATHWFEFRNTFSQFMTLEGFALFAIVLVFVNALHEIGHGLVAKHYQCRVTEMGVALIFMLPVCYCDTSDTWRLTDNRKRLLVSAGGMLMELAIATVACLVWLLLPDGVPRTLAFFLAVTSLATTLFVNLNPFMKFDGYYLLADALGVDNLQEKSFSNFRWQLRQWFTGTPEQKPYRTPESSQTVMNLYAISTWTYRLILYFSICWMVYQFWFKALGLMLMTGVFMTMIAAPVVKESAQYVGIMKKHGLNSRSIMLSVTLFLLIALLFVPLPRKVSAPAVFSTAISAKLFSTSAAKISAIHFDQGDKVVTGQKLLTLENPDLEYQKLKIEKELETLKTQNLLETQWMAGNVETQVSEYDISARKAALNEIDEQINSLVLVAASDSTVTSVPSWLRTGVWVNTNTVLAELASTQSMEVRAYVPASKSSLLNQDTATFYSYDGRDSVDLNLASISDSNVDVLDDRTLAVTHGGEVAVLSGVNGELQPVQGWLMAVLSPADSTSLEASGERSGYVMFPAQAKSLISSAADRLYGVVIRESGF